MSGFVTNEILKETIKNRKKRRSQLELLQDGFDRLLNMNMNIYKDKPIKNNVMNIGLDVYKTKTKDKVFKNLIDNLPIGPIKENDKTNSEAKKEIGIARSNIKKKIPIIEFDMNKIDIEKMHNELASVLHELLNSIELDKDKWVVYYDYGSGWKGKPLSSISGKALENQIENELEDVNYDYQFDEHDYDFFPYGFRKLKHLTIINYSKIEDYKILNQLITSGASKAIIHKFINRNPSQFDQSSLKDKLKDNSKRKSHRKKREGRFWKWYLLFKEIDLSRFMIFHKLGKEEVHLIERDNCFIYACAMSGLNPRILDDLRYSIQKRSIAMADITRAANECDLKIKIKLIDGKNKIIGNGSHELSLLLMENHYMINERVNVSPYYIKHRDEINNDNTLKYWKLKDRMLIYRKHNGRYEKGKDYSLRKVLLALFEVGAFKPISAGEYMTFNSLICFEKIDPIKNLEYDAKYCTRLKCFKEKNSNSKISRNESSDDEL